jgi:membrane-associated phospholipid phosphatase
MEAPRSLSVYDVDLPSETAITVGALGLYFMVDILVKPTLQAGISCQVPGGNGQCDPATLSAFDRYAVGKSSQEWLTFSDVMLATSIVVPVVYLGLESLTLPTSTPVGDFAKDLVVVTESMALTAAVDTVLKFAFRRPRPSRYLPDPPPGPASYDAELSLPSAHAAMVAAATTSLTTTIFLRHPTSKVRFLALGAGITLSALTALARVESGQHFPTDVITGLLVGAASGFVVPFLHRKRPRIMPTISFNPSTETGMLSIAGYL